MTALDEIDKLIIEMTKWIPGEVSHEREAGIFELRVWLLKATGKHSYESWALILKDGDSNVLPCKVHSSHKSLDEAKKWIEDAVREMCQETINDLEK